MYLIEKEEILRAIITNKIITQVLSENMNYVTKC